MDLGLRLSSTEQRKGFGWRVRGADKGMRVVEEQMIPGLWNEQ